MGSLLSGLRSRCQTTPKGAMISVRAGGASARGGGGLTPAGQAAADLAVSMSRATQSAGATRVGKIVRMVGKDKALVDSVGCPHPIRVALGQIGQTYLPGQQIMLHSGSGDPGEVALSLPPNCQSGSQGLPSTDISEKQSYVVPFHCPAMISGKEYVAVAVDSGQLVAWKYIDGTPVKELGRVTPKNLGAYTITSVELAWRVPNEWRPSGPLPTPVEVELSSVGTLTFDNATSTITRSTGSWISDKVRKNDSVRFDGWSGQGANARTFVVTNVTATVLTVQVAPEDESGVSPSFVALVYTQVAPWGEAGPNEHLMVLVCKLGGAYVYDAQVIVWRLDTDRGYNAAAAVLRNAPDGDSGAGSTGITIGRSVQAPGHPVIVWADSYTIQMKSPYGTGQVFSTIYTQLVDIYETPILVPAEVYEGDASISESGTGGWWGGTNLTADVPSDTTRIAQVQCVDTEPDLTELASTSPPVRFIDPNITECVLRPNGATVLVGGVDTGLGGCASFVEAGPAPTAGLPLHYPVQEDADGLNGALYSETVWGYGGVAVRVASRETASGHSMDLWKVDSTGHWQTLFPEDYLSGSYATMNLSAAPAGRSVAIYNSGNLTRIALHKVPDGQGCTIPTVSVDAMPGVGQPDVMLCSED